MTPTRWLGALLASCTVAGGLVWNALGQQESAPAAKPDEPATDKPQTPDAEDPGTPSVKKKAGQTAPPPPPPRVEKSDAEWSKSLTPMQFNVLRRKGTERAFSGQYWHTKTKGTYVCSACATPLFRSETKFDSGTGWPSYYRPIAPNSVKYEVDQSLGMVRREVMCAACDGHLGHVFDDGPRPTGLRYCMNSVSLLLKPDPKPTSAAKKRTAAAKKPATDSAKAAPPATKAEPKADAKPEAEPK